MRGFEGSGFDISNFVPDMLASLSAVRELRRPAEYASVVARHAEARRAAHAAREAAAAVESPSDEKRSALIKSLGDVDELLRLKNYTDAEARLVALKDAYREEPRVYFGLGQAAMLSANDAFDEAVQEQRLTNALGHFRQVVLFASPEQDKALLSRTHVASGRVLAFLERREEAMRAFDAPVPSRPRTAYREGWRRRRSYPRRRARQRTFAAPERAKNLAQARGGIIVSYTHSSPEGRKKIGSDFFAPPGLLNFGSRIHARAVG